MYQSSKYLPIDRISEFQKFLKIFIFTNNPNFSKNDLKKKNFGLFVNFGILNILFKNNLL